VYSSGVKLCLATSSSVIAGSVILKVISNF
jgi:hypothetical protein